MKSHVPEAGWVLIPEGSRGITHWWYGMISSIDPLVVLVSEPLALFPLFFFPSLPLFGMAR
jgi:hypothetical protein